ncbi:hypothetical protein [Halorubrum vacuolatum]|uniref:Uncharacterized protein n=1 Tax=Halorubrum vacuolatum TaxID=63740 RepID=A0A238XKP4_HALVU|nr:hypothetical protein [Halorubrum vacuolatum]SNR59138.1 hypothetical protein SAMN06264855_11912 [Halorubrum vacuolatum]
MDETTATRKTMDPRDRAIHALAAERHDVAAEAYTTAARAILAGHGPAGLGAYEAVERSRAGWALAAFATAAVCHRIAGAETRADAPVAEGIVVAGELRDHVLETPVERAVCNEFVGDLRAVIDDGERAEAAYDRAVRAYDSLDLDAPAAETGRPFLQAGTELCTHLSRPDDLSWDDLHGGGGPDALTRRVAVKRSRMQALARARVSNGKLHAPRGSTEYRTGRFICPACGSDDVNYVANTTLCLRCSTPTEPN